MSNNFEDNKMCCSFCGRPYDAVDRLIKGMGEIYICNDCVQLCSSIIYGNEENANEHLPVEKKQTKTSKKEPEINLMTPREMKDILDTYVVGQDNAKVTLSVAVYNHYKRILSLKKPDTNEVELQKSNVLLLGPTGVGKTMLAQTLAKVLNVPFAIADATTLTEAGYVGEDVENILLKLIQAAEYDIKKAEKGIIYIDEIDKISRRSENRSITRDVSGEGVQQALLKIVEGTVSNVPATGGRKHPHQEFLQIDTSNILFICGGAFDGIEKVIEKRVKTSVIGFENKIGSSVNLEPENLIAQATPHDLVKFGLIPELVGRLPIITTLTPLDEEMLVRILKEPKNSLVKQYTKLLDYDDVELVFDDEALRAIARLAIERKTGARGLRSIIETTLNKIMFDVPSDPSVLRIVVTKECVENGEEPEIFRDVSASSKKTTKTNDQKFAG